MAAKMKRFLCMLMAVLMIASTPISVFAENGTNAVETNAEKTLQETLAAATNGETVSLEKDTLETVVMVPEGVTLDLNGCALEAKYVTCYGNIVDTSADNAGLLKVSEKSLLIQETNEQLPVKTEEGYRFFEVIKFNTTYDEAASKFVFQPFVEKGAHEFIKAGTSGVTINVKISWTQNQGTRSQNFVYNEDLVEAVLNSYNSSTNKYGKVFTLTLKSTDEFKDLTFTAVVASNTKVEKVSEPITINKSEEEPVVPPTEQPGTTDGKLDEDVTLDIEQASAFLAEGTKVNGETLALTTEEMSETTTDVNLAAGEEMLSLNVHVDGVAKDNTVPVLITINEIAPEFLNQGNITLYHVENGETVEMTRVYSLEEVDAHNEFYYDILTGTITMALASFSEIAVVSEDAVWEGNYDYSWYTNAVAPVDGEGTTEYTIANADQLAAFGAIVGGMNGQTQDSFTGKTVKLLADINFGDKDNANEELIFHPIGYYFNEKEPVAEGSSETKVYSTVKSFSGVFDGNGHTISNFYQNTWEIKGDYNDGYPAGSNHYKDAMGLFGYVFGGTVKNLTVDNFSSDGEFTPTGVIAAYAENATFENIAITHCNPRVYNTGNGGIVGIAGRTNDQNNQKITLKNITVDNSNKISALWGSWDVACGGLVGMFRGNADGGNGTIHFENCHVSAQIDVYNDVCANYQYYAYRYAGMIIGSVRHNTKNDEGKTIPNMAGISASDCTVNYGDWNDYYYCEFVKNSIASYTHDYQFSRVDKNDIKIDENGKITGCTHDHAASGYETTDINGDGIVDSNVLKEDKTAVYLPFHQLFTGYSWGVSSIGLEKYSGIVTNLDITEGDQEESVEKFKALIENGTSYMTETTVTIGELFKEKDDVDIKINTDAIIVSVTPVGNNSTANGVYTANANEWTKGTLKFSGVGEAQITITDYYFCKPTVINVQIDATQKFETKFTGAFLYRVGNQNDVKLDSLFEAATVKDSNGNVIDDTKKYTIDNSTFVVAIDNTKGSANGTYTRHESDWKEGTLKFSGTGVVSVTISDAGSIPYVLNLEVVDGYNVTAKGGNYPLQNRNSILLDNITMNDNGTFWLENSTLYGNGFEFDVMPAKDGDTTNGYIGGNYAVGLKNAILDNVKIIGEVYTKYGAGAKDMYNYPTILTNGDSIIANSYVSNGSAAVRAQDGNLQIINSTLEGGIFANLDIRGGTVTLENVITINQSNADGSSISNDKGIVGIGIAFYACNTNAKLNVETDQNGNPLLKQYNHISKNVTFNDETVKYLKNAVFGTSHQDLQYIDSNGVVWVNTGIMSATEGMNENNLTEMNGYEYKEATVGGKKGFVYTLKPTSDEKVTEKPDAYVSTQQYVVLPTVNFDHEAEKNYKAPSADSNEHCYYNKDTKRLNISFDEGKNKVYDPNILAVQKAGVGLEYTVTINGEDYTEKTITFDKDGKYTAVYTYVDPYNFRLNDKGEVEAYSVEYEKEVIIEVSVVEAKAKNAKFTFYGYSSISKTAATTITEVKTATSKSGNLYIMPASTGENVGSTTIDGITVNCPRVYVDFKDNSSDFNWLYPIFLGVKIEDYANGGTADTANTIVSPTSTSKPANLTILTADKPSGGGGWSSGSGESGKEGPLGSGTYKNLYGWTSGALGSNQPANSIYCQFTYKDNKGTTYYYVIEFYRAKHDCPGCVTEGTMMTMADGTQKAVEDLKIGDMLMIFNHVTGQFEASPMIFNTHSDDNEAKEYEVLKLAFSDGEILEIVQSHGLFDTTLMQYVYINYDNYEEFIGHEFYKLNIEDKTGVRVILESAVVEKEITRIFCPVTYFHMNSFANGFLNTPNIPGDITGLVNYFEYDSDLKYNEDAMQRDIETYGLYTYDDFKDYISEEAYNSSPTVFLKVAVGKGMITFEQILDVIEYLLAGALIN